ncbi:Bacterial hemoglobin [Methylacidimicrobium cyclopophantes]|uniref:Bacterial hemoglobin n=1 Tax=Methylacidimicrobium cyclopophantes TaxID=1041766 RepID=A0A5E6MF60_9BACT|nr:globin domain-containing protein [Methylacidimicrobium cyclopophantes]VVM08124.1 Bacterial hemoglobin [Methylacidimicrobium cyclopophantes]
MTIQPQLIEQTGAAIESLGTRVTEYFYDHLFRHYPELRPLFPAEMTEQKLRLFQSLLIITSQARNPERLAPYLQNLGIRHIRYGARPEHYSLIGRSLLATLRHFLGSQWTREMAESWIEAYNLAATLCVHAAFEAMQPARFVSLTLEDAKPIVESP